MEVSLRPDVEAASPKPSYLEPRRSLALSVGKCQPLTAEERFGKGARKIVREQERGAFDPFWFTLDEAVHWPGQAISEDDDTSAAAPQRVPVMQKYRNNLTALSQKYNIYLVAYQGRIFVYRPRDIVKQTLPARPDLHIKPEQSFLGRSTRAPIDRHRPHTINHLITGFLGPSEVVVACYDDGDVVAYYMSQIEQYLTWKTSQNSAAPGRPPKPQPCLHENVGSSAWGLGVHQQCRLIAVSSNRHEVVVFAPALGDVTADDGGISERRDCCACATGKMARVWNHFTILVQFGRRADNIPNICFIDDERGHAERICAVDINAVVWIAHIWQTQKPVAVIPPLDVQCTRSEENFPAKSRGWGIAAIPKSSFMAVESIEELIGAMSPADVELVVDARAMHQPIVGTGPTLAHIPDNPCHRQAGMRISPMESSSLRSDPSLFTEQQVSPATDEESWPPSADPDIANFTLEEEEEEEEQEDEEEQEEQEQQQQQQQQQQEQQDLDYGDSDAESDENWVNASLDGPFPNLNLSAIPPAAFQQMFSFTAANWQELHAPSMVLMNRMDTRALECMRRRLNCSHRTMDLASHMTDAAKGNGGNDVARSQEKIRMIQEHGHIPHMGSTEPLPGLVSRSMWLRNARPCRDPSHVFGTDDQSLTALSARYRLLRLWEKDVELRAPLPEEGEPLEFGIVTAGALTMTHDAETHLQPHFQATSRLNMVAHVPALSLVVLGSPTGRVLLLTLTRLKRPISVKQGRWVHGMRVEWVLPRRSDEEVHRRQPRPLHGMAVGPVAGEGEREEVEEGSNARMTKGRVLPRRYRLMLHYRDHSILTYEISREEPTGRLCIC